jgi:4,5-dihydroxyphthalate decarboxylase
MHLVAVRAELLDTHPWIARDLLDAFEASKRLAYRRLENPRMVSLAWLRALQEEERAILGPDPWCYGLGDANRRNLATFLGYAVAQGIADEELALEELFHPATVEDPPVYV